MVEEAIFSYMSRKPSVDTGLDYPLQADWATIYINFGDYKKNSHPVSPLLNFYLSPIL
jgi:hypothetical protein